MRGPGAQVWDPGVDCRLLRTRRASFASTELLGLHPSLLVPLPPSTPLPSQPPPPPLIARSCVACLQLLEVEATHKEGVCGPETLAAGFARMGSEDQLIVTGKLKGVSRPSLVEGGGDDPHQAQHGPNGGTERRQTRLGSISDARSTRNTVERFGPWGTRFGACRGPCRGRVWALFPNAGPGSGLGGARNQDFAPSWATHPNFQF